MRSPGSSGQETAAPSCLTPAGRGGERGGGRGNPRQRLCRALALPRVESSPLPARPLSCPAAGAPGERPTGVPCSAAPGPPPPSLSPLQQLRRSASIGPRLGRPPPPEPRPAGTHPFFTPAPRRRSGERTRGCRTGGLALPPEPHSLSAE